MAGKRTEFYRMSVAALVKRLGLSKDEVKTAGMTRLSVISSARPDIGKKALLDLCRGRTVSEVRAVLGGKPGSVNPTTFNLNKSQRTKLERVLKKFGADETSRVDALLKIIDKVS